QIKEQDAWESFSPRFDEVLKIEHRLSAIRDVPDVIGDSCNQEGPLNQAGIAVAILHQQDFAPIPRKRSGLLNGNRFHYKVLLASFQAAAHCEHCRFPLSSLRGDNSAQCAAWRALCLVSNRRLVRCMACATYF